MDERCARDVAERVWRWTVEQGGAGARWRAAGSVAEGVREVRDVWRSGGVGGARPRGRASGSRLARGPGRGYARAAASGGGGAAGAIVRERAERELRAAFARAGPGALVEVDTVSGAAQVEESARVECPVREHRPEALRAHAPPPAPVEEGFPAWGWWAVGGGIVIMFVLAGSG